MDNSRGNGVAGDQSELPEPQPEPQPELQFGPPLGPPQAGPTRRVRLVRRDGQDVSTLYGRGGGGAEDLKDGEEDEDLAHRALLDLPRARANETRLHSSRFVQMIDRVQDGRCV